MCQVFFLSNFDDAEIGTVNPVMLKFTIVIDASRKLYLYIGSQLSSFTALPPADFKKYSNIEEVNKNDIEQLFSTLEKYNICAGNSDENFVTMIREKKGVIKSRTGNHSLAILMRLYQFM